MTKRKPIGQRIWDYTRGPENRNRRRRAQRSFLKTFPKGHEESLRDFAKWCATLGARREFRKKENYKFLIDVHYRAFEFIARYGVDYTPRIWPRHPGDEPKRGECSLNSFKLMISQNQMLKKEGSKNNVLYVEGLVVGEFAAPMLHAWNSTASKPAFAVDWTHYAGCQWSRYIGVPFTQEEFLRILQEAGKHLGDERFIMLFHRDVFPYVEPLLQKLVRKRSRSAYAQVVRS